MKQTITLPHSRSQSFFNSYGSQYQSQQLFPMRTLAQKSFSVHHIFVSILKFISVTRIGKFNCKPTILYNYQIRMNQMHLLLCHINLWLVIYYFVHIVLVFVDIVVNYTELCKLLFSNINFLLIIIVLL